MSVVFPRRSRTYFLIALIGLLLLAVMGATGVWYYATPKYTRVGYAPLQPVSFSHAQHVGELGLDCTYCHSHVGESPHANIPATQVCMNCHGSDRGNIKADSPALAALREAAQSGRPVPWVQLHRLPDYAYFNHAVHVRRGVSCVSCHGQINQMPVVFHAEPLSMSWCLECHRNPQEHLRPADRVTDLNWDPSQDPLFRPESREEFLQYLTKEVGIRAPTDCSGCHR